MGLGMKLWRRNSFQISANSMFHCNGMRFKNDVLEIKLNGMSVFEILNLTVDEAVKTNSFNIPRSIKTSPTSRSWTRLPILRATPKYYLEESQRLKLVKFMGGFITQQET